MMKKQLLCLSASAALLLGVSGSALAEYNPGSGNSENSCSFQDRCDESTAYAESVTETGDAHNCTKESVDAWSKAVVGCKNSRTAQKYDLDIYSIADPKKCYHILSYAKCSR
jgi:hypothetical protein